jgi:DNA-binding IclR family transcriptional regulator
MSEQVKSLVKSMSVLEYLGNFPNGAPLQDIAESTGINKTSVHRMLGTFEQMGYVSQAVSNKNYRLTLKLLHLGHSALNSDVIGVVKPILNVLMDELGETINFISREGDQIVFREKFEPQMSPFRTRTFVGMYSQMYCSAAGKCFLAFSSRQEQENYWLRNESIVKKLTANTITNKEHFFKELESVREQGYAVDAEENEAGISCTAVPVFDASGIPAYAVSISTLTPRIAAMGTSNLAARIKQSTLKLEQGLFKQ